MPVVNPRDGCVNHWTEVEGDRRRVGENMAQGWHWRGRGTVVSLDMSVPFEGSGLLTGSKHGGRGKLGRGEWRQRGRGRGRGRRVRVAA